MSRTPLEELKKQAIDQPLHFSWAFLTTFMPTVSFWWLLPGIVSAAGIVYREWDQWPSDRWWDPPMDWSFFAAGAVVGLVVGL